MTKRSAGERTRLTSGAGLDDPAIGQHLAGIAGAEPASDPPASDQGGRRRDQRTGGDRGGTEPRPLLSDEALEVSRLVVDLVHAALSTGSPSYGRRPPEPARESAPPAPSASSVPASGETATTAERPPIHGGAPTHLSPHAVRAAVAIYQHGQCSVGELASTLGVSMGWASRIAEELESRGYAVRERSAEDHRVVRLRLSARALEEVDRAYRWRGDAVALALDGLDANERAAVRAFLRRLADAFIVGTGR
ncbi:MAG: MarR family winged helix-turn-helix transcriptional regulator [Candidatus Limnocylindrales bacterium]